jgi:hypothetical protein
VPTRVGGERAPGDRQLAKELVETRLRLVHTHLSNYALSFEIGHNTGAPHERCNVFAEGTSGPNGSGAGAARNVKVALRGQSQPKAPELLGNSL